MKLFVQRLAQLGKSQYLLLWLHWAKKKTNKKMNRQASFFVLKQPADGFKLSVLSQFKGSVAGGCLTLLLQVKVTLFDLLQKNLLLERYKKNIQQYSVIEK